MKRMLWLGIGLAIGALTVRAVTRRARALTPGAMADNARKTAGGLVDSVRSFVADVREGMAEREEQLRTAFAEGTAIETEPSDDF
jgi:chromosome condensin MukBEF MukE localization factor